MTEQRYDDYLRTYQLCRTGFLSLAVGLVPFALLQVSIIVGQVLVGDRQIEIWLQQATWLDWLPTLTTWSTLIGATLLWGRWDNSSWQRRTSLLMTMCLIDVGIWFLDLGDPQGIGDWAWFRGRFGNALGWAEVALLASLSGDFLTHLGVEQAEESAKSTRSLAASGAMIWLLLFCETANLRDGWPIKPNAQIPRQTLLLSLGTNLIWIICLIQITALVVAAFRQSDHQVRDMEADDRIREDVLFSLTDADVDSADRPAPAERAGSRDSGA